jgi:hypothetical protein
MRFWHTARWVLLIVWAIAVTLLLVRGPEDTWVRDASGQWVAHGHPAGPPPPMDYEPPPYERALPFLFLGLVGGSLVFAAFFAGRSPAGRDSLHHSIRYYGALSLVASALAICFAIVLLAGLLTALESVLSEPEFIVLCVAGVILLLKVLSWHADGTKRVLEAHYELKRATDLIHETLDRLTSTSNTARSASVDNLPSDTV